MDPITLAAGFAQSLGGLFKGIFGFNSGNAQAEAERNAARQAEQQGGEAASQQVEQGNALAAQGAVAAAANGGGFVGSSLGAIQNIANRSMFNARAAAYRGRQQAVNNMYDATVSSDNATNSLIGGVADYEGSMLGSMAKSSAVYRQQQSFKQLKNDGSGDTTADSLEFF